MLFGPDACLLEWTTLAGVVSLMAPRTVNNDAMPGHCRFIFALNLMWLLPPRFGWPSYLLLIYWRLNFRTIHLHPVGLVSTWHHIESIHSTIGFSSVVLRYDIFSRDPLMSQARDGMTTRNASQVPPPAVTVVVIDVTVSYTHLTLPTIA